LIIIWKEDKEKYIQALIHYRKERTDEHVTDFFFAAAIGRMKQEIEEKKNLSHNYVIEMEKTKNN
jgi:hypothetical protein